MIYRLCKKIGATLIGLAIVALSGTLIFLLVSVEPFILHKPIIFQAVVEKIDVDWRYCRARITDPEKDVSLWINVNCDAIIHRNVGVASWVWVERFDGLFITQYQIRE